MRLLFSVLYAICYHMYNLKKRGQQLQPATLLKVTLLHACFHFLKIVQMVPNRANSLIFDDKELPWINSQMKSLVQEKNKAYKFYVSHK